jgi:hypothetical protein
MTSVLIRDVPDLQLERIRLAAAQEGSSLQNYLARLIELHSAYLARRDALDDTARRLKGQAVVPEAERQAVLDAIDADHDQRAEDLADRLAR